MRYLLLLTLFLTLPLHAEGGFRLLQLLQRAQPGDYWVTAEGKNRTLLLVRHIDDNYLILEEVTRPDRRDPPQNWKEWAEKGGAGATSWISLRIHLQSGCVEKGYSYTLGQWMDTSGTNSFLQTLFSLTFSEVADLYRRRTGPLTASAATVRPAWNPPLICEGTKVPNASFRAWSGNWPSDNSELSGKRLTLYIPATQGAYPAYFPYWIEVGDLYSTRLRVIDSGCHLQSPQAPLS